VHGEAAPGDELLHEDKPVGRLTSVAGDVALGYVRTAVPEDAQLAIAAKSASARVRH
jgi:hypothetical protein